MEMVKYSPFTNKQVNYFNSCNYNWLNIAEGGKRAGKNVLNILAWCSMLEAHPDRLHLASGVSLASAKLNIIDSNGYGVKSYFQGRCREGKYQERNALFIYTKTGEKILLLSGGGKEGDERYIKGNTYGTAYITEVNECCKTFVKEAFDRTLSSKQRKIFLDLNPKSPNHWFYEDILNFHMQQQANNPNYGLNYGHFTIIDNLSFDNKKIQEVLSTYNKGTIWYKRDIRGERTNAEGLVYSMFTDSHILQKAPEFINPHARYIAIDVGTTNPTVFLDIARYGNQIYVLREYIWDSKKQNREKADSEYVEDLKVFMGDVKCAGVIVDPAAKSFIVALTRARIRTINADTDTAVVKKVIEGIRLIIDLLTQNKLFICAECKGLINEFYSYTWDEKASLRGEERPIKENDHCLDALRYYTSTIIRTVR